MAITATTEVDFVVYTKNSLHVQTIKFDKDKWYKEMLPILANFYFEFMTLDNLKD